VVRLKLRHSLCTDALANYFSNPRTTEYIMSLETLIAAGVFGWLVVGMVMMGLGIW